MSDPGSILVSEDTFALVNNFFSFEKPKEVKVKGFLRSIKCYKLQKKDTSKEDIFSVSGKGFQISINKKLIHKSIISDLKNKLDNLISDDKD